MKKDFIGGKQITRKQALKGLYPIWGLEKKVLMQSPFGNTVWVWRVWSDRFKWGPWAYSRREAIWLWLKIICKS